VPEKKFGCAAIHNNSFDKATFLTKAAAGLFQGVPLRHNPGIEVREVAFNTGHFSTIWIQS
jgi:hypothetical protein